VGGEVWSSFITEVYDVKFYPYGKPTDDPIFAAVGGKKVGFTPISLWSALTNYIIANSVPSNSCEGQKSRNHPSRG
jgi:hypothetical protein